MPGVLLIPNPLLGRYFGNNRQISLLDYGGGNGMLTSLLKADGFENAQTYDPFVAISAIPPEGRFDLITCFEVVEHSPMPMHIFNTMMSLLTEDGIILFSTLVQPAAIDQMWASPRTVGATRG